MFTMLRFGLHRHTIGNLESTSQDQLYKQQSLNFLHKLYCTEVPHALTSQIKMNVQLHTHSTRQDTDLALPQCGRTRSDMQNPHVNMKASKHCFLYEIVKIYNTITQHIRDSSIPIFDVKSTSLSKDSVCWCSQLCPLYSPSSQHTE